MPELAAIYALGILFSAAITGIQLLWWRRHRSSIGMARLNENLAKVGFFWSDHADALQALKPGHEEAERVALSRSVLISGFVLGFLSWIGVLFSIVLIVSMRFFVRSKLERSLMTSPLTLDTGYSPDQVQKIIDGLLQGT
jgi:hypothetical protein